MHKLWECISIRGTFFTQIHYFLYGVIKKNLYIELFHQKRSIKVIGDQGLLLHVKLRRKLSSQGNQCF